MYDTFAFRLRGFPAENTNIKHKYEIKRNKNDRKTKVE